MKKNNTLDVLQFFASYFCAIHFASLPFCLQILLTCLLVGDSDGGDGDDGGDDECGAGHDDGGDDGRRKSAPFSFRQPSFPSSAPAGRHPPLGPRPDSPLG